MSHSIILRGEPAERKGNQSALGYFSYCAAAPNNETTCATSENRVGYSFDPLPRSLLDLVDEHMRLPTPSRDIPERERRRIMNDRLRPVDIAVLRDLIRYRRMTCSCWRAKEAAAREMGVSTKTVQMSWRRLDLHGFIEQVPVDVPDPDDPYNGTGYRFTLLFALGAQRRGVGPDRRPPLERRGKLEQPSISSPPAPPPELVTAKPVSSPPREPVSSKSEKPDLETPPSSSSGDDIDADSCEGRKSGDAVEAVATCYGPEVAGLVGADAARIARKIGGRWDCFTAAVFMARATYQSLKNPLGMFLTIALDFVANGISAEAQAARDRILARQRQATSAPPPPKARPTAVQEIAALEGEVAEREAGISEFDPGSREGKFAARVLAARKAELASLRTRQEPHDEDFDESDRRPPTPGFVVQTIIDRLGPAADFPADLMGHDGIAGLHGDPGPGVA